IRNKNKTRERKQESFTEREASTAKERSKRESGGDAVAFDGSSGGGAECGVQPWRRGVWCSAFFFLFCLFGFVWWWKMYVVVIKGGGREVVNEGVKNTRRGG
ncbi:hypothetical protein A2U01_0061709, partial [Trifolium medium]|nr:hypothetical protein [Trifolium medium]